MDGQTCGLRLTVKAYPAAPQLQFRIILALKTAIWRVDFSHDDDAHPNSLNAPADIRGALIEGPHFHAWSDNRRFGSAKSLPSKLQNARQLHTNIRNFESAFRWFCGETKIVGIDHSGIPDLPPRTELL
jgi:hypothetical protein